MAKVRRRLQDCSLCEVPSWEQSQVHEWLYRMGAPKDEEALETDLFQSISSFEELCSELIDDNYRADYLDPKAHDGFTPDLSRRVVVELKGLVELSQFKDKEGSDWPAEDVAKDCKPEAFAWMSSYQTSKGFQRSRRLPRLQTTAQLNDAGRSRTENYVRLSALYAGDGNLYTSGESTRSAGGAQQTGAAGGAAGAVGVEMANVRGVAESKTAARRGFVDDGDDSGDERHDSIAVAVSNPYFGSPRLDSRLGSTHSSSSSSSSSSSAATSGAMTGGTHRSTSLHVD